MLAVVSADADRAENAALTAARLGLDADGLRGQWSDEDFRAVLLWAHRQLVTGEHLGRTWCERFVREVAARPQPAWNLAQVEWMLDAAAFTRLPWGLAYLAPVAAADALDGFDAGAVSQRLSWIADRLGARPTEPPDADGPALRQRIADFLDRAGPSLDPLWRSLLSPVPAEAAAETGRLTEIMSADGVPEVVQHCLGQVKVEPTRARTARARALMAAAPRSGEAKRAVLELFCAAGARGDRSDLPEDTETALRGLVWLPADDTDEAADEEDTELLARVAVAAASTPAGLPGYPRAPRLAASAVTALGRRRPEVALRTLARLASSVRNKALANRVQAALATAAEARGWAPAEVMELAVDDHGLDADGRLVTAVGAYEVVVEVTADKARLFVRRGGRALTGVPEAVKDEIGPLRAAVKEIGKTLAAQRQRIDGLFSAGRTWAWADWQQRYLDHPVTAVFGRTLLWRTEGGVVGLPERDPDGWVLCGLDGERARGERVSLWHPLHATPAEVGRWRDRIDRQPVRQVYREIYRLTPAEEQTATHSHRFAAHILRYRQANALMRVRGWDAPYLGAWDGGGHSTAVKEFRDGTWRAAFFHDLVDNGDRFDWEARLCTTGQVRFARREAGVWTAAPLAEVPAEVFSEAMRDVDLFIGGSSIAAAHPSPASAESPLP
ncbi:DUF4132 domain-containing protein [Hamadaea tsunoensis]|uniref:DUF4132 domain-containing protein n=1 Tax=Hamadaea tsunoensis TaxID=53368 RepID=UPI00040204CE|nr:DUF4132 domain-containing protein [Hamadaea tsunoensis]